MNTRNHWLPLLAAPLLVACGAGSGSTNTSTASTAPSVATASSATISGTVPGTKIEAFCNDGTYHTTNSQQNGTSKHPFELTVSKGISCRYMMTMNENDDQNRIINRISFNNKNALQINNDTDIGYVPLPSSPQNVDHNGDHMNDDPVNINLDQQTGKAQPIQDTGNTFDQNNNGIIDIYDDKNANGQVDAYEDQNHNGTPDIQEDQNRNGIPDMAENHNSDNGRNSSSNNEDSEDNNDENSNSNGETSDNGNSNGGGSSSGGGTISNGYILTAWNDLGMHCMDGNDFSVWSVLPPFNNLHAQLKDKNNGLVTAGVILTYEATMGTDGKMNTSSADKTNFWNFSNKLFPHSNLQPDIGLLGNKIPNTTPEKLTYDNTNKWWKAEGLPMTPYNDDGTKNYYPLIKVTAKDTQGNVLATAEVVLPVSDEMDCKRCHASSSLAPKAKPNAGWANNTDPEKDFKLNVLRLHDERMPNAVKDHISELKQKGYNYNSNGLEATVNSGTPIMCAACHKSNALPGTGVSGVKAFTAVMHSYHANVVDPYTNLKMSDSQNRDTCYACHPGASTKCLRGAMGDAKDAGGNNVMQCQSCHGNISHVGNAPRVGWMEEPNCQACHHDSTRELSAITLSGALKTWTDKRFATNPDTPAQGFSLFRFSTGHGSLQCEACHGSPHAIFPAHKADNLLSKGIQGHAGMIGECSACHSSVPNTVTGGPHGMHPVGQSWVKGHEDVAEKNAAQCKACHGQNYRGSVLSETWTNRSFSTEWGTKNFAKGHKVSCYDCHNGPNGD